jgi:hypothetical protein
VGVPVGVAVGDGVLAVAVGWLVSCASGVGLGVGTNVGERAGTGVAS